MKPIDQLVKLGIVEHRWPSYQHLDVGHRNHRLVGTEDWLTEEQVLSNNDVMAAVIERCIIKEYNILIENWGLDNEGVYLCSVNTKKGRFNVSEATGDEFTRTIILAGLQALQDV